MKKNLSLLKPYLHTTILDNQVKEKVTYMNIPTSVDVKSLSADIKMGAVQFSGLKRLLEKENEPKYILVTADNIEQGYMAITYLAAGFNRKHGIEVDGDWEKKLDVTCQGFEEWEESELRVPVIEESFLKQNFGNWDASFAWNGLFVKSKKENHFQTPYWMDCTSCPVCIVCDSRDNYSGICFETEQGDNWIFESLNYFQGNDKIYVLTLRREEGTWGAFIDEDDEEGDGIFEDIHRRKWNSIVLNFSMDEVNVELDDNVAKKYYKLLYKGVFASKNILAGKGFSYERLANIVMAMSETNKCHLVENIVNYAIKEWNSSMGTITNKDFDFMNRFCKKHNMIQKGKENRGKINATDRMMKELVGMEDVKKQVLGIVNVMKYNQMRMGMGIKGGSYHNVHVMLGAPGTAKTTVAKLMGEIMAEKHLLPDTRFAYVNGAELKGKYVGHSAPKTKELFKMNDIIVIDEAYSLVGNYGENDSFSREALAQLIIELENHSVDKLVVFAGYGGKRISGRNNKMKEFLDANPGIKSRITSTIYFDSYNAQEMVQIFYKIAEKQHYNLEEGVGEIVCSHFEKRIKDENFGNGREARRLLETSVMFAANRVFGWNKQKYTKADMKMITYQDVEQAILHEEYSESVQQACQSVKPVGFCIE